MSNHVACIAEVDPANTDFVLLMSDSTGVGVSLPQSLPSAVNSNDHLPLLTIKSDYRPAVSRLCTVWDRGVDRAISDRQRQTFSESHREPAHISFYLNETSVNVSYTILVSIISADRSNAVLSKCTGTTRPQHRSPFSVPFPPDNPLCSNRPPPLPSTGIRTSQLDLNSSLRRSIKASMEQVARPL